MHQSIRTESICYPTDLQNQTQKKYNLCCHQSRIRIPKTNRPRNSIYLCSSIGNEESNQSKSDSAFKDNLFVTKSLDRVKEYRGQQQVKSRKQKEKPRKNHSIQSSHVPFPLDPFSDDWSRRECSCVDIVCRELFAVTHQPNRLLDGRPTIMDEFGHDFPTPRTTGVSGSLAGGNSDRLVPTRSFVCLVH